MILRIKGWEKKYENNRTRQIDNLDWVPVPNKLDGDGYTLLLDHKHGAAHLGAWYVILAVASRRPKELRGTLTRDCGKPHDPDSLARISRIPSSIFKEALPRLLSPEIGWLEQSENADSEPSASRHMTGTELTPDYQETDAKVSPICALARAQKEGKEEKEEKGTTTCAVGDPQKIVVKMPPPLMEHPLLVAVRDNIYRAMRDGFRRDLGPPDERLCLSVIEAMGERDIEDLTEALIHMCQHSRDQKPRSYGFILSYLRDTWKESI